MDHEQIVAPYNSVAHRIVAVKAAKTLVTLWMNAGVVGIDHNGEIGEVQMANLNALRAMVGNRKLKMERGNGHTRYSCVVDGVEFFFLSVKH